MEEHHLKGHHSGKMGGSSSDILNPSRLLLLERSAIMGVFEEDLVDEIFMKVVAT